MHIIKKKALAESVADKKKIPPVGAWGNYRKLQRPYARSGKASERKLLIDVKDLTLAYDGKPVVSNLSLQIHSGDFLCIIGENGSGKTTLTNALLGLKKPSGGSIEFHDLKKSEVGVLLQKTEVQNDFPALVGEIVLSGRTGKKKGMAFYSKSDKKIAFENMEKLGITSIAKRSFRELSGGQQQRTLLARSLCSAEKLLVLDEPVASLDPKACADTYRLISDINKKENMAIIMVSHDIDGVLEHASHILMINKGSYRFYTIDEYLKEKSDALRVKEEAYGNSDAYKYKGGVKDVED